jgi:hypothetical protein
MANPPLKRSEKDSDFDPSQLLHSHGEHEKNISDLTSRMAKVEGRMDTPQALADFLEESARDSRKLEGVFAEMFCRFMEENPKVQECVKKRMEEVDRNYFFKTFKRTWFWFYSVVVAVGAIIIKELLGWLLALIPHH